MTYYRKNFAPKKSSKDIIFDNQKYFEDGLRHSGALISPDLRLQLICLGFSEQQNFYAEDLMRYIEEAINKSYNKKAYQIVVRKFDAMNYQAYISESLMEKNGKSIAEGMAATMVDALAQLIISTISKGFVAMTDKDCFIKGMDITNYECKSNLRDYNNWIMSCCMQYLIQIANGKFNSMFRTRTSFFPDARSIVYFLRFKRIVRNANRVCFLYLKRIARYSCFARKNKDMINIYKD